MFDDGCVYTCICIMFVLRNRSSAAALLQSDHEFGYLRGQLKLMMSAGKLIVGWSWQSFITALFALATSGHQQQSTSQSRRWLRAGVNCIVALVVIVIGAQIELRRKNRVKEAERRNWGSDYDSGHNEGEGDTNIHHHHGGGRSSSGSGSGSGSGRGSGTEVMETLGNSQSLTQKLLDN